MIMTLRLHLSRESFQILWKGMFMNSYIRKMVASVTAFSLIASFNAVSFAKNSDDTTTPAVLNLENGEQRTGGVYTAEKDNQSACEVSGDVTAGISGAVLKKVSGNASSADAASFRGINACVRVSGNAALTLTDCDIQAEAKNATGVFAYENGVINLHDCRITVTGGGAGGVQVAGGGTLTGSNLTVSSASKAAIRSDRGGGTINLSGGTYTSTGPNGCPAIYSTADIYVQNAECTSVNSRAVIIEGKNTVTVENCFLSGNDKSTKEGSIKANVLLYQSASGDASPGTSVFTMTGGEMICNSGSMFYCTNTTSQIHLTGADLTMSEDGTLLIVSAGRWGKNGKNGGSCTLTAKDQQLEGSISVDSISDLKIQMDHSNYTGAVQGDGKVDVILENGSTWKLTGDSTVSSISGDTSGIDVNGYTLLVNGTPFAE